MALSYAFSSPRWQRASAITPSQVQPSNGVNVEVFRSVQQLVPEFRGVYWNGQYGLVNTIASQVVTDELLQGIAKSDVEVYEALGSLVKTDVDNYEALQGLTQVDSDNYEALARAVQTQVARDELLAGVAKSDVGNYEAGVFLTVTTVNNWEAQVSLSVTSSVPWESSQPLTVSVDGNWEASGLLTVIFNGNWESLAPFCYSVAQDDTVTLELASDTVDVIEGSNEIELTEESANDLDCEGCGCE